MSLKITALQVAPGRLWLSPAWILPAVAQMLSAPDLPHSPHACGAWQSGRNPNLSPSSSTSSIISCSSSGVGFCPSIRITFPSSLVLMQPSSAPSTKMSKAALNSGERRERRCGGLAPYLNLAGGQPWERGLVPDQSGQSIFRGVIAEAGWAAGWGVPR